jgi:DMSO/TMAO reductase YedYZ molybdopterin-dependent catalytic subunit
MILSKIHRRTFLQAAPVAALPLFLGANPFASAPVFAGQNAPQLIVRQDNPVNLEFPFTSLNSFITPNNLFYVRNHFPAPELTAADYRLRVEGLVERTLNLTLDEIRRMPAQTVTFTMECAGNTRALLNPPGAGVPWQLGAVSTAEWTGVPLADVLARAGVRNTAVEVQCEGADQGRITTAPGPAGQPISFARGLPLTVAQNGVLLAYRMNGAELPANHGFPLRLVVPGWYGMASVKWLTRLALIDRPFTGYFQAFHYIRYEPVQGQYQSVGLTTMPVKALIAQPAADGRVERNSDVRVHGAAWVGNSDLRQVEVSTDGGQNWRAARLLGQPQRNCWRLWEHTWRTPGQPGRVMLMARATDIQGNTQPERHDPNRGAYMVNHVIPVPVEVR